MKLDIPCFLQLIPSCHPSLITHHGGEGTPKWPVSGYHCFVSGHLQNHVNFRNLCFLSVTHTQFSGTHLAYIRLCPRGPASGKTTTEALAGPLHFRFGDLHNLPENYPGRPPGVLFCLFSFQPCFFTNRHL